ncbi:MAG: bifunctional UDP-N-acetylglucosamine diphosphorylase/glucosamine-1-phosphate N-acetyltransferase GlmU, partial [Candidatus Sericytochromatia bacterium]
MTTPISENLAIAIMAAGKGTRMKSERTPKVLHTLAGRSIVMHVLHTAFSLKPESVHLIVGHESQQVRDHVASHAAAEMLERLSWVEQLEQLGTGHAIQQVLPPLQDFRGHLAVLNGDVPLLAPDTLSELWQRHLDARHAATLLTTSLPDPTGYGRIIKNAFGRFLAIREHKDCSPEELAIKEFNTGIYLFDWEHLSRLLPRLSNNNAKGEYYLTDILGMLIDEGLPVGIHAMEDPREVLGINSRKELAEVEGILRTRIREQWMLDGVTLRQPETISIDIEVELTADVEILPNTQLEGRTRVGAGSRIGPNTLLRDAIVGENSSVLMSMVENAEIGDQVQIGPFSHLRPESRVETGAKVGNFVELKKATLGPGSKASHLSYLGDVEIGSNCNIGAGTITCNYDGVHKHRTRLGNGVFTGSHSTLVAPLELGDLAYTAAGSVITADVPAGALGLGRAHQVNKEGWVAKKR